MQDCRVDVVDVRAFLHCPQANFFGRADDLPALDPGPGHPDRCKQITLHTLQIHQAVQIYESFLSSSRPVNFARKKLLAGYFYDC